LLGFTSLSFFFYFGLPNYCEFNVQSLFISARLADRLGTNNRINAVITIRMGFTECLYYFHTGKWGRENGDSALFLEEKIGCCPHFPGAVPIFPTG